jgi:cytochrome c-type biogenesis protein CcmH/NrfG
MKKSLELDPGNPAAWNNLANYYGHFGPVAKAFDCYANAIELTPNESVYYQNYGTTVYMFRKDAMEHFHLAEQQVFDKALDLYAKARRLDPDDFPLATDIAQTYYGIHPLRTNDALQAWTNALQLARDEIEREGIHLHLARVKMMAGRLDEARAHLNAVTNEMYNDLKRRLTNNWESRNGAAKPADAAPASTHPASP